MILNYLKPREQPCLLYLYAEDLTWSRIKLRVRYKGKGAIGRSWLERKT